MQHLLNRTNYIKTESSYDFYGSLVFIALLGISGLIGVYHVDDKGNPELKKILFFVILVGILYFLIHVLFKGFMPPKGITTDSKEYHFLLNDGSTERINWNLVNFIKIDSSFFQGRRLVLDCKVKDKSFSKQFVIPLQDQEDEVMRFWEYAKSNGHWSRTGEVVLIGYSD